MRDSIWTTSLVGTESSHGDIRDARRQLVASVIEGSGFSGDATFDLSTALEQWEEPHRKAFENWLKEAFA